jgi:hypothetical protein
LKLGLIISVFVLLTSINVYSQIEDVNFNYESYTFKAVYDTAQYCSVLKIYKGTTILLESECESRFTSIVAEDLDNDGKKEILMDQYSGGAHCCTYLIASRMVNDRLTILDSIWWGDSGYEIKDLNGDGKKELQGVNTWFAYAFTNFSQSRFNIVVYGFKKDKFYDATKQFPKLVDADIKDLKNQLKDFTIPGFECPQTADEDTFNTDAGAVKAILAPIVADYYNLDDVEAGYDYVRKIYKCKDVNKFIKILQNDYKLK